jgi:hypothetical protein
MLASTTSPKQSGLRVIVGGFLGLLPAGGISWDYVQYPVGFASLGHDVYYIEDTRVWPIYQNDAGEAPSCATNVAYLAQLMDAFGLGDRWAYRDEVSGNWVGMSGEKVAQICLTADVFVIVSCSTYLRDEYRRIPARVLIDTDPMFTQIQFATQVAFTAGETGIRSLVAEHTHHFTFGENIGQADCRIPDSGVRWRPTRQPIALGEWRADAPPGAGGTGFTTVMNWIAGGRLTYNGETWGQKDIEFMKVIDVPQRVDAPFSVVVGQTTGTPFPADTAKRAGWSVLDPTDHTPDWNTYRDFIRGSLGEFSVAKETYVKAWTGWFSCRSACYLASGRPVVTQDTGWTKFLPTGNGLFGFTSSDEAVAALDSILTNPANHAAHARQIAEESFDARVVLGDMLGQVTST